MSYKATVHHHPIQLYILERLRVSDDTLRYSNMRPPNTESDLYNYHLQQLVTRGLVERRPGGYGLTSDGIRFIVELNPLTERGESHRFKLASLCLVTREHGDALELLYQHRSRQPDAGEKGIIGGGIKRGELATTAAKRRLWEESGLTGDFSLFGMLRKRRFDSAGDIYSDILFHVCLCQDSSGDLITSNAYGEQAWIPLTQALKIEKHGAVGSPQLADILGRLAATAPLDIPLFYLEEDYQLHDL